MRHPAMIRLFTSTQFNPMGMLLIRGSLCTQVVADHSQLFCFVGFGYERFIVLHPKHMLLLLCCEQLNCIK